MDRPPQLLSITNFYPRPPRGGRLVHIIPAANLIGISIHALREEGDHKLFIHTAVILNFYPRPPRGGRQRSKSPTQFQCNFYPRPPRGGRPSARQTGSCRGIISIHALREEGDDWKTTIEVKPVYFYPRPPRGGRRTDGKIVIFDQKISIHALREEGDLPTAATQPLVIVISIHALREEGDLPRRWPSTPPCRFLSTPSARRATCFHGHAPFSKSISIHALREEGDFGTRYYANQYEQFLSTPSARRATCSMLTSRWLWEISIHALREEGDMPLFWSKGIS